MEKIVVVTGSYNPITKAHVELLTRAMNKVNSNRGIIVPTDYDNLFTKVTNSKGRMALSNKIRLEMIKSVCKEDNRIEVSDYEMKNKSSNRTYGTINYVIDSNPESIVYYACGADKLDSMVNWKNIDELLNKVKVIIFKREDVDINEVINSIPVFSSHLDSFIVCDGLDNYDVSSTLVRNSFFDGNDNYRDMLTPGVYEIMKNLNPNDYPQLTFYKWIENMHKTNGMHDKETARRAIIENNNKIFNNMDSIKSKVSINKKLVDYSNIEIINDDVNNVSHDLLNGGYNPVIINVFNKVKPAGTYYQGKLKNRNDEEELCLCSDMSLRYNKDIYPILSNDPLLFNKVLFFRNGSKKFYSLLDNPFYMDVILIPALSFRIKENKLLLSDLQYQTKEGRINNVGLEILYKRIQNAFELALSNKNDSIVLGDLGIKNYYIPEVDIALCLSNILKEYRNKFKHIILALPGKFSGYKNIIEMVENLNG